MCPAFTISSLFLYINEYMWKTLNSRWWLYLPTFSMCMLLLNGLEPVFFLFHGNQPDSIRMWNIYMAFFFDGLFCLGTIVTCLCGCIAEYMIFHRPNYFHYHILVFFFYFPNFCSQCVCLQWWCCSFKLEHTHIYINKILWPRLQMQTSNCTSLSTIRQYCLDFMWEYALFR